MSDPIVAQKGPYAVDLKAGGYLWCACGRSANQPFCDGSHKGSAFTPRRFTLTEDGTVYLCGCKRTGTAPFCNGTHERLP